MESSEFSPLNKTLLQRILETPYMSKKTSSTLTQILSLLTWLIRPKVPLVSWNVLYPCTWNRNSSSLWIELAHSELVFPPVLLLNCFGTFSVHLFFFIQTLLMRPSNLSHWFTGLWWEIVFKVVRCCVWSGSLLTLLCNGSGTGPCLGNWNLGLAFLRNWGTVPLELRVGTFSSF